MRDAITMALKLFVFVFLLAICIAMLDLRLFQPMRTPPCDPTKLEAGYICLSQIVKTYPNKVIWIDARNQDAYERHTVMKGEVYPIRPGADNYDELIAEAMQALMEADSKGYCIVVFCGRDCDASVLVANELKKSDYGIKAPIYILHGGWDELKKEPSLVQ